MADRARRSENVVLDAFSCAIVPELEEGGPSKWLKLKNLQHHSRAYEPGGREFESLRARQLTRVYSGDIGNVLYRRHG